MSEELVLANLERMALVADRDKLIRASNIDAARIASLEADRELAVAKFTKEHIRANQLAEAIRWVITDCGYMAPEAFGPDRALKWIGRLSNALTPQETP